MKGKYTFEQLTEFAKIMAIKAPTIVEVKDYTQHGWRVINFATDKFGGCYADIKEIDGKGIYYCTKGAPKLLTDVYKAFHEINEERLATEHARLNQDLYESINEQYD